MKRITPADIYKGAPCSVVSLGCALGIADKRATEGLYSPKLKEGGYLSLKDMNALILAHVAVDCKVYYKRSERPALRDFAHANEGRKAIVCVLGHYVYFDGHDYHSFFWNGGDAVVQAWYLEG